MSRLQPGSLALMYQQSSGQDGFESESAGECRDVSPHRITEIALERTSCFGRCPEYTVTLRADGTVTYVGRENVDKSGEHIGIIDAHQFDRLATLAEDIGFMDRLEITYTCNVSDNPTVFVSIVRDGKRKTIAHYAPDQNGPITLWSLEQAIDLLVDNVRWQS
jgi:hypothetical protein